MMLRGSIFLPRLLVAGLVAGCVISTACSRSQEPPGLDKSANESTGSASNSTSEFVNRLPASAKALPKLTKPERRTIAILPKTFATGTVKLKVRADFIGWQGTYGTRTVIVRVTKNLSGKPKQMKRTLDFAKTDLLVRLTSPEFDPAALKKRVVTIEFRPTQEGFSAFLVV